MSPGRVSYVHSGIADNGSSSCGGRRRFDGSFVVVSAVSVGSCPRMQTWFGVVSMNRGWIADTDLGGKGAPLGRFFRRWDFTGDDGLLLLLGSGWVVVDGGIICCITLQ